MDFVDLTIIGVLAFWIGFGLGILIAANPPTKAENEQELKDYRYDPLLDANYPEHTYLIKKSTISETSLADKALSSDMEKELLFGKVESVVINRNKEAQFDFYKDKFEEVRDTISAEISTMNLIEKFMPLVDSTITMEDGRVGHFDLLTGLSYDKQKRLANAKQCALITVDYTERVLSAWGKENDELQNMDGEWRRIDSLKKAIERYEG